MQLTAATIADLAISFICAEWNLDGLVDNIYIDDWQPCPGGTLVVVCIGSMLRQRVIIHDDGQVHRHREDVHATSGGAFNPVNIH